MTASNSSNRVLWIGLFFAIIIALALRCPQLEIRPMHNDEAVNSIKLRDLWERGTYRFDPLEYHGPTLIYLELAWVKLIGAADFVRLTEAQLRGLTVLFGLGLILLLPLVADGLGVRATLCAALLTAISPAMVFYSRYFIHEMLLVFLTLMTLAGAWRYRQKPGAAWALLIGAGAGLMQATKETFVFSLAALAAALVVEHFLTKRNADLQSIGGWKEAPGARPPFKLNYAHAGLAILTWLMVGVVLFSSFFTNARGPLDSLRTYLPWLHRAGGASPHNHPWYFYLQRLAWFHAGRGPVWSEVLILGFAWFGAIAAFARQGLAGVNPAFARVLALYTILLTLIYSAISYKTPWCLLSFWSGMILLAGVGVTAMLNLLRRRAWRVWAGAGLLLAAAQLGGQAWRSAVTYSADPRNPYVYAQTSPDILNLVERVKTAGECDPQHNHMVIEVVAPRSDYWPLPWYLRQFSQVGWWDTPPTNMPASVLILSTKIPGDLATEGRFVAEGLFALRPQTFLEFYLAGDLDADYLARRRAKAAAER